jgi:DNA polymerase-1
LPKTILKSDGSQAGAIVGFGNLLLRLWRAERPRAVVVAWDTLEEPTYRHEAFEEYQSGREFDDPLVEQLDALPGFVASFGFVFAKQAGFEADDFLAAAAAQEEKRGGRALVATGDRDAFQLASERTTILYPVKGGELLRVGPAEVRERYGVEPKQVPDFIALRGDPSDKIPGAPGVGAKGAAQLLQKYGNLEAALTQGRFPGLEKKLRLYRSIATMNPKAPLPKIGAQQPTWDKAAEVARGWGLKGLALRIEEAATEANRR